MTRTAFVRRFVVTLVLMGLALPVILYGARKTSQSMFNAPARWIPEDNPQRQEFFKFARQFGVVDTLVVSWEGCTIDDPRLETFAEAMTSPEQEVTIEGPIGNDETYAHTELVERVRTGYGLVRDLTSEPINLTREEAAERLEGTIVGSDGETSCAIVVLREKGVVERKATLAAIYSVGRRLLALEEDQMRIGGPTADGVAIDAAASGSMQRMVLPSCLLVLVLSRICLRSWRLTFAVILVAFFGELVVLSLVSYSGAQMNAVLTLLAPLVFVLTVSGGVHLVNYYHEQVRHGGWEGAARRALIAGWLPCTLAAATTAIGLVSLFVSTIVPVRQFGLLSAIGVLLSTGLLFLVLPGPMVLWRTSRAVRRKAEKATDGLFQKLRGGWDLLTALTTRASFTVSLVCLVLLAFCGYGLTKIDTSVNIRDLLKPESTTIRDYRWLESAIGPLVTVEAIVKIPEGTGLDVLDELELVSDVETALRSRESIGGTLSAATFLPEIPPFAPRDYLRRVKMRRVIERKIDQLATSGYLAREEEANFWRVTGRVPAFGNFDYGVIRNRIAEHVDQVISDYKDELAASSGDTPLEEIDVVYTGSMPLVYDTQRELLDDLVTSFLWALGLVALVMILVQRSIIGGLIVMIPNLFPTVILFGAMGWRGQAVDIGGMMTASIALGIAVDGTLHFLTWFRRELDDGSDPRDAVGKTYRHCATAMAQTTVICGTGLSVFALSDFVPSQRFAWMMVTLLVVALVGDLILLPALLVGPFARWFRPKDVSRAPQEKISSDETSRDEAALPTSPSENGAARSPESTKVTSPHPVDTPDS